MAFSLAEILIFCMIADGFCRFVYLPGLVGMVAIGIILGPACLNRIDPGILSIGNDLRLIALIVILLRAGFSIRRKAIFQEGFRVIALSVVPSILEAAAVTLCSIRLLGLEVPSALLLGFIIPAVSPAVVVPLMIRLNEEGIGTEKDIPNIVLACTALDNVFNILMCGILLEVFESGQTPQFIRFLEVPLSVFSGLGVGAILGFILYRLFEKFNPRATKRGLIILSVGLILVKLDRLYKSVFPFSSFIATLAMGFIILERREPMGREIAGKMSKIWVFAEIALFAMVGAQFNFSMATTNGWYGPLIIIIGLSARMMGVLLSLAKSRFTTRERLFIASCNIPKATVQAAMGAAPLLFLISKGMPVGPGETILGLSVLAILSTSAIGAWLIPIAARRFLRLYPLT